jgi:hypothetical protein
LLNKRINAASITSLLVFALIISCQPQNNLITEPDTININEKASKTQVKGKAEFPDSAGLTIKASLNEVRSRSTVSIIYPANHPTSANQTVATGLTDNTGNFIINPDGAFAPSVNESFILEAEKRIGMAGQDKMTISTYIRWNGSGWNSITTPGISINSKTTAVVIIAGLNTVTITAADTINKIVNGTPQNINGTVTAQIVNDVAALVNSVLTNNYDPVHYIGKQSGNYLIVNPIPMPTPTPTPVGEFKVNLYTTSSQINPDIAMDSTGNFVVSWESNLQDGSNTGIYARMYNNTGTAQSADIKVNTFTTGLQSNPSVAMDSDGDFVITWQSNLQDGANYGGNYGIYAQRYNASGVPQGAEFLVNTYTTTQQTVPVVAMDSAGDFVIAWASNNQDSSSTGVYAQRFNNTGAPQGAEFKVNTFVANHQRFPSIAMDSSGNFIIAWTSTSQDAPGGYGIYAQRYNASGVPQGAEFPVNTYTTSHQRDSSIAMDSSGNFLISWHSYGQDGSGDGVYAQRYNNAGVAQGPEFKVNTYTTSDQKDASIAMDSNGNFVILWSSSGQDGSGDGVYAQRYNNAGVPQGPEFKVNPYTASSQRTPSVAMDSDGDFIGAWTSFYQEGFGNNSDGIFAQRYNASGNPR